MEWLKDELEIKTPGQGLHDITSIVETKIQGWNIQEGMCWLYLQHTSASLLISENYDPTARQDLEEFLKRLAPENQPWHKHITEGADDSPSHMRALLTGTSLAIPVDARQLSLGSWQGIYFCEHRRQQHRCRILIRCLKTS
jgi:secondary thiamine-phosphate synthase enzyme